MNESYSKAPDIFTGKDLDYLKDIFGWNYIAYKNAINTLDYIENKSVFDMYNECIKLFKENMNLILKIVKDGSNEE